MCVCVFVLAASSLVISFLLRMIEMMRKYLYGGSETVNNLDDYYNFGTTVDKLRIRR